MRTCLLNLDELAHTWMFLIPCKNDVKRCTVCVFLQSTCRLLLPNDIPWTRIKKKKRSPLDKLHLSTKVSIQTSIKASAYFSNFTYYLSYFSASVQKYFAHKFCPQRPNKGGGVKRTVSWRWPPVFFFNFDIFSHPLLLLMMFAQQILKATITSVNRILSKI